NVRTLEQVVKRCTFECFGRRVIIGIDDPHTQRRTKLGDLLPNPSESTDPEGGASQVAAEKPHRVPGLPFALTGGSCGRNHLPSDCEEQRNGELCGRPTQKVCVG